MTGILKGTENVAQPMGGLLKLESFSPVPISLNDSRILSKENLPGDLIEGAVKLLSCLEALARDTGFDIDSKVLLSRAEEAVFEVTNKDVPADMYAEAFSGGAYPRVAGFDHAAADCACKLAYCLLKPSGRFTNPARIRADDRTCNNILLMVQRMTYFLDAMGPVRRICFKFRGAHGKFIDKGYGLFLTDGCLWDVNTSQEPLSEIDRLRLLVRYVLSTGSNDPAMKSITNIGIMNPRLNCAYMMPVSEIPSDAILFASEGIIGLED